MLGRAWTLLGILSAPPPLLVLMLVCALPLLKKKNCLPMIVVLDAGNYGEEQRYQRLDFLYVYMNKK